MFSLLFSSHLEAQTLLKICALGTTSAETIDGKQKSAIFLLYLCELNSAKDLAEELLK